MKLNKILGVVFAGILALASCTSEFKYEPAPAPQGEQIFVPLTFDHTIDLGVGNDTFTIPFERATKSLEEIEVAISAEGEKVHYFTIPGTLKFEEDATSAELVVAVDLDSLGINNFVNLVIKVADKDLTTPYGSAQVELSVGINLPWYDLNTGVLASFWYNPKKVAIQYQQVDEDWNICKIVKFNGANDYVWYWNTKTNDCVVPPVYAAYYGDEDVFCSDAAGFYALYQGWYVVDDFATAAYREWAPAWERSYDFFVPYYDPEDGYFVLADWEYIMPDDGTWTPTGSGYQFGCKGDESKCDIIELDGYVRSDYSLKVSYGGMFVAPSGDCSLVLNFACGDDVAAVQYGLSLTATPAEILEAIVAGEGENVVLGGVELVEPGFAAAQVSGLEPGLYNVVAVPCDVEGALQADDAVATKVNFAGLGPQETVPQVGVYSYTDDDGTYEITLSVNPEDPEDYWIESPSGLPDGSTWHATFDKATNTLVCEGIEVGYESDGNLFGFGSVYGWYNKANLYTYGYVSFMEDTSEDGSLPLVFDLDASGFLTGIENLRFGAYVYQSKADGTPTKGLGWGYLLTDETVIDYEGPADAPAKVQNFVEVRPVKEFSRSLTNVNVRLNKTANASESVLSENIFTSRKLIQL